MNNKDQLADQPAPLQAWLLIMRRNQARTLIDQGRASDALPVTTHSLELARELVGQDAAFAELFQVGLANSLEVHGRCLAALGRSEDAIVADDEAISIFRELTEASQAHLYDLAKMLGLRANHLDRANRHAKALADSEEAIAIRRRLWEADPDSHTLGLAHNLTNYAAHLNHVDRYDDALKAGSQALDILKDLPQDETDRLLMATLAHGLKGHGLTNYYLRNFGHALKLLADAANRYRELVADNPGNFRNDLAESLMMTAECIIALGGGPIDEAVLPLVEARHHANQAGDIRRVVMIENRLAMIAQRTDSYTFKALMRAAQQHWP